MHTMAVTKGNWALWTWNTVITAVDHLLQPPCNYFTAPAFWRSESFTKQCHRLKAKYLKYYLYYVSVVLQKRVIISRSAASSMLHVRAKAIKTCMIQKPELLVHRLSTMTSAKILAAQPSCNRHCSTVGMELDHCHKKNPKLNKPKQKTRPSLQMLIPCISTTPGNSKFPDSQSLAELFS